MRKKIIEFLSRARVGQPSRYNNLTVFPVTAKGGALIVDGTGGFPDPDDDADYGWMYQPQTRRIIPNKEGSTEDGTVFVEL